MHSNMFLQLFNFPDVCGEDERERDGNEDREAMPSEDKEAPAALVYAVAQRRAVKNDQQKCRDVVIMEGTEA